MKRIATILTVAMLGLMVSCNKEQLEPTSPPNPGSGEVITAVASLRVAPMKVNTSDLASKTATSDADLSVSYGASTDSKVTPTTTELFESFITRIGMFQFVDDSIATVKGVEIIVTDDMRRPDGSYDVPLTLRTSNEEGRIYFLTNIANLGGRDCTEDEVKALTLTRGASYDHYAASGIPMMGVYRGAVYVGIDVPMKVERLISKVVFNYTVADDFTALTPTKVTLKNASNKIYLIDRITGDGLKTADLPLNTDKTAYNDDIELSVERKRTITWYLPVNLKGINENLTVDTERYMANVPVKNKATYVQFTGKVNSARINGDVNYNFLVGNTDGTKGGSMGNFNVEQNTLYTINANINGVSISDPRVTIDYGEHMSNSAIIRTSAGSATATFNLNKIYQGNPTVGDLGNFEAAFDRGDLKFEIVWGDYSIPVNLVYDVVGDNVNIVWANNDGAGNVIVAAKDAYGVILWSWHLWNTNTYDPDAAKLLAGDAAGLNAKWGTIGSSEVHTYGTSFVGNSSNKVMMDRNLGAVKAYYAAPTDGAEAEKAWGLMYQWGRKDPMPRGTLVSTVKTCYPSNGYEYRQVNVGTTTSEYNNSLGYSIKNPLTFITTADASPNDWYTTTTALQNDYLWATPNGEKGIYDPCPDGWRVPISFASTWADFNGTAYTWYDGTTYDKGGLYNIDGGVSTWYGTSGMKLQTGEFAYVGGRGYLWASIASGVTIEASVFMRSEAVSTENLPRASGMAVRCISDVSE